MIKTMKNENENKIETLTLWIARDFDNELYCYRNNPEYDDSFHTYNSGLRLNKELFPSIKPGKCRRATVVLDDEKPLTAVEESVIQHFKN